MEGEESQIVNLDSLSSKQRLKEYKLAAKEIKSKDSAKKKLAIEKFKDERYLLEGECLVPLIESMAPKKVRKETRDLFFCFVFCFLAHFCLLENFRFNKNIVRMFYFIFRKRHQWREDLFYWN